MKVYFNASSRSEEETKRSVFLIYDLILENNNSHVFDCRELVKDNHFYSLNDEEKTSVYKDAEKLIKSADVVIVELSTSSMTMGYLIKQAQEMGKPVVVLHTQKANVDFLIGALSDSFQLLEYSKHNIRQVLKEALKQAAKLQNVRFNLMIPQHLNKALDAEAERQNMSRARFLREIIVEKLSAISQEE